MTDEIKPDDIERIKNQIIVLAKATQMMNNYGSRLAGVNALCESILAPSPREAAATQALASLQAAIPKLGRLEFITAEWDKEWHFIFSFRFTEGYRSDDGFDLRVGEPGREGLEKAIDACSIALSLCDLTEPEPAGIVPNRRIVYPKPIQPATESKGAA